MEKSILYFEHSGSRNTEATLRAARARAAELGIRDVVVATTHGGTALQAADHLPDAHVVAVTLCEGFQEEGWTITAEEKATLRRRGITVVTSIHALDDGVASAFTAKFGGKSIEEVVQQTLYRFCQGLKVCVEVVLMAADAGAIGVDREVLAIAGTGDGADTCIVVKPAYARRFFELEIREIVAKPRIPS